MACESAAEMWLYIEIKPTDNSLMSLWMRGCIYWFTSHSPASRPDLKSGHEAGFMSRLETLRTVNLE